MCTTNIKFLHFINVAMMAIFGCILLLCGQVLLNSAAGIHQTCLNSASVIQCNRSVWNFYREGGLWAKRQVTQEPFTHKLFLAFHSLSAIGIFGCTKDHMTSFCWITWMSTLRYSFYIQNVILCKLLVFSLKLSSLVRRTTWRHIHKERKKYWRPKWPPTNSSCRKFSWHKLLEMWRLEPGSLYMQTLVISQRPTPLLVFV